MSDPSRSFSISGASTARGQPAVLPAGVPVPGDHGAQAVRRLPYSMIALALIGLAVAFYDSYAIYNGQLLWCPPPINGCNEVAASPYARIFDLPVGYYGVVYRASGAARLRSFGARAANWCDSLRRLGSVVLALFHGPAVQLHPLVLHLLPDLGRDDRPSYRGCGRALEGNAGASLGLMPPARVIAGPRALLTSILLVTRVPCRG
jgi:Vitamin K epoxide reductase family